MSFSNFIKSFSLVLMLSVPKSEHSNGCLTKTIASQIFCTFKNESFFLIKIHLELQLVGIGSNAIKKTSRVSGRSPVDPCHNWGCTFHLARLNMHQVSMQPSTDFVGPKEFCSSLQIFSPSHLKLFPSSEDFLEN